MPHDPNTPTNPEDKRRIANQRNSQLSTGPTTPEGKQAVSQNPLKFGFFSKKALLPGESWEEFLDFHAHLLDQLRPQDPVELHVLEQYSPHAFRLKRLPEIEAGIFARYGISSQGIQCGAALALVSNLQ